MIFKVATTPAYRQAGLYRELEITNQYRLFPKGWMPSQNDLKILT
jgi:hypothetical protein